MCRIEFDYSALRGLIREVYGSETAFAPVVHMSSVTLSSKLNGKTGFTETEMFLILDRLGKPLNLITKYFFKEKLKKS